VLSPEEIGARYRVRLEQYQKRLEIENATIGEMIVEYVIPAVECQLDRSQKVLEKCRSSALRSELTVQVEKLEDIYAGLLKGSAHLQEFISSPKSPQSFELRDVETYHLKSKVIAESLRECADLAERHVSHEFWKLPRYRELLFSHRMR
jgi:glutamine synthetase